MLERDLRLVALTGGALPRRQISTAPIRSSIVRAAKARGPAGHLRRLDQPPGAQRERRRRLPHLLQALAAAAQRGRPAGDDRGARRRHDRRHRLRPRSAGRRDQAPALRRSRRRRDRARDAARRRRCASSMPATCRLPRLLRALSTRPAEILGLPGGRLAPGAPADLVAVRSRRALVLDKRDAALALEEHALRRGARCRAGCLRTLVARPDSVRIDGRVNGHVRGSTRMPESMNWTHGLRHAFARRCADRLSARLDPVRPAADPLRRPRRHPQRSARAISAPPMCCAPAARASPPRRCCSTR